ncbi:MAG: MarR family winged helix-turn-helix transcriptional regulator [Candidatus Nucleicultricaceae bacterium]
MIALENCPVFGFYKASRQLIKTYNQLLEPLHLTYVQYVVISALHEKMQLCVDEIGHIMQLDSGTLTPLLKRLEKQEIVVRKASKEDERRKVISLTKTGQLLQKPFEEIRSKVKTHFNIEAHEIQQLLMILQKLNGSKSPKLKGKIS